MAGKWCRDLECMVLLVEVLRDGNTIQKDPQLIRARIMMENQSTVTCINSNQICDPSNKQN